MPPAEFRIVSTIDKSSDRAVEVYRNAAARIRIDRELGVVVMPKIHVMEHFIVKRIVPNINECLTLELRLSTNPNPSFFLNPGIIEMVSRVCLE